MQSSLHRTKGARLHQIDGWFVESPFRKSVRQRLEIKFFLPEVKILNTKTRDSRGRKIIEAKCTALFDLKNKLFTWTTMFFFYCTKEVKRDL